MYPKAQKDAEKWVGSEDFIDPVTNVNAYIHIFGKGFALIVDKYACPILGHMLNSLSFLKISYMYTMKHDPIYSPFITY